jgi:hypothetical protein
MKHALIFSFIFLMTACIPDHVKEKMNEGMSNAQLMFADMEFKKALSQIELHKLRNGEYPNSLAELRFLSVFDSSMYNNVQYTKLDSVYELNLKMETMIDDGVKPIELKYPDEFWKGLGCVKSNLK